MARIRTCKPEFYVDSTLGELGHVVRDFYRSTWNFFDDYGRFPLDPKSLAVSIYPYEKRMGPKRVAEMIMVLIDAGRFILYEVDGRHFLQVPNWHHQKIDRPSAERIPPPSDDNTINDMEDIRRTLDECSTTTRSVGRYQVSGRYQVGNTHGVPENFDRFWKVYPRKVGKDKAIEKWSKAAGASIEIILSAVENQKQTDQWRRGVIPNPATWLNQKRWEDELDEKPEATLPESMRRG
ncbi:hypothetical protein LCGC14_0338320 [marine sediment metagenome]|uniref:Uncharacterized protein n=1 Tax=marine sediment metagenome TaxID=412755 RepID=A0A0F9WM07_9ZZZZ